VFKNRYESFFFRESENEQIKKAYYSIGKSISDARFYFSDAAVRESIFIATGKRPEDESLNPKEFTEFQETISNTVRNMSAAIIALIQNYLSGNAIERDKNNSTLRNQKRRRFRYGFQIGKL
jgi:hypothetical protein